MMVLQSESSFWIIFVDSGPIHIIMHTSTHTQTHYVCVCASALARERVCVPCVCVCVHTTHTHVYVHTYGCICTPTDVCVYTRTHTVIQAHPAVGDGINADDLGVSIRRELVRQHHVSGQDELHCHQCELWS